MWTKKALASVLLTAGMLGAAAVPLPAAADAAPRWVHYDGRSTQYSSRWDRDGDGIPNRYDRTPYGRRFADNDRYGRWHYGGPRWDRDGDGVPNRYDARPNNPYRY
ncbi:MAG TPA: hypothetical protein VFC14_19120 [Burkholderiales bacterium]|nr:hypothetical protein [Burkholderiales bacterium]